MLLPDIATEDGHRTDPYAQGEECLTESGCDDLQDPLLHHPVDVRYEIEPQPLCGTGHCEGVCNKDDHNRQEGQHHPFRDLLQTPPQSEGADPEPYDHHDDHETDRDRRIPGH